MHNLIVKHPKCSAGIWSGVIGWREYMSTAKIYKRWQVWVILWLFITAVNLYRIDTKPLVSGGNPPIIEFDGRRAQLYVMGPYTLEELKREYRRGNKNYYMWQLDPGSLSRGFGESITYGVRVSENLCKRIKWSKQPYFRKEP